MAVSRSAFLCRHRWSLLFSILGVVLTLIAGVVLWQVAERYSVAAIQARIDALKPVITGMRISLIALISVGWPVAVNTVHRLGWVGEADAGVLHGQRWRVVTWLAVIEAVLGQNLFGQVRAALG